MFTKWINDSSPKKRTGRLQERQPVLLWKYNLLNPTRKNHTPAADQIYSYKARIHVFVSHDGTS
jgi:hypothetical protein